MILSHFSAINYRATVDQGRGQVQLTKYSSIPSTQHIYQVQVLVKHSFFKVLKYIQVLSYQVQVQVQVLILKSFTGH